MNWPERLYDKNGREADSLPFFAYDGFSGKEVEINVSLNQDIECCSIK
jgi:hypothetical protein